jgi:protein involved in polysaccharide export with SLBB domain
MTRRDLCLGFTKTFALFGLMVQAQSPARSAEDQIAIYFEGDGIAAGRMDLKAPIRLLSAISARGGFKDFAGKNRIQVMRDGKLLMTARYKDMVTGEHPESDPYLKDGDHIIVPPVSR